VSKNPECNEEVAVEQNEKALLAKEAELVVISVIGYPRTKLYNHIKELRWNLSTGWESLR